VSFAARVAAAFGIRARILTIASADANLTALAGHDVRMVPSEATLTFEHRNTGGGRELRVTLGAKSSSGTADPARGFRLSARDVPPEWLEASGVILAPLLADDIDVDSFSGFQARFLLAQGLQRILGSKGEVLVAASPVESLTCRDSQRFIIFLSDVETSKWSPANLQTVVSRSDRVVVTRGTAGATIYRDDQRIEVPAYPADVVDTTGAGDVFATAFILAASKLGLVDEEAGLLASAFAAASVERVGPAPLPPLSEVARRAGVAVRGLHA
jgi:hypothetical protein